MKTQTIVVATSVLAIAITATLLAYIVLVPSVYAASTTTASSSTSSLTTTTGTNENCTNNSYPIGMYQGGNPGMNFRLGPQRMGWGGHNPFLGQTQTTNIPVGQTITVTSTQGEFRAVGSPSENGTASGTLTFTVTGKLSQGYTLAVTSGSIVVNGTTYSVSSGTAQMGSIASNIVGQGTTTPTGQFLLRAQAHGNFSGNDTALLTLDFQAGSTEYGVVLTGTIQG